MAEHFKSRPTHSSDLGLAQQRSRLLFLSVENHLNAQRYLQLFDRDEVLKPGDRPLTEWRVPGRATLLRDNPWQPRFERGIRVGWSVSPRYYMPVPREVEDWSGTFRWELL